MDFQEIQNLTVDTQIQIMILVEFGPQVIYPLVLLFMKRFMKLLHLQGEVCILQMDIVGD